MLSLSDTPGPPGPIKIKELTKESALITWDAPEVDGGAPVNNYVIERREASMRAYKTVTSKCSKTSYKITGLAEGMMYYFRVLPENIYGVGEPCETSDVVLVCEVPLPPSKLEVVDVTKSSVSLAWEKPVHDGGSRLIAYIVEACKAGTDKWMKVATLKLTDFEFTIVSLNENEQYLFRVRAVNSRGPGEPKEIVTAVTVQEQRGVYCSSGNSKNNTLSHQMLSLCLNSCLFSFSVMPKIDLSTIPQKMISVLAGKPLELDLPIIGRPLPVCSWFFNDNKVKIQERVKIKSTGKFSKITILNTTIDDSGVYTLEVKNVTGVTTEDIKVVILGKYSFLLKNQPVFITPM